MASGGADGSSGCSRPSLRMIGGEPTDRWRSDAHGAGQPVAAREEHRHEPFGRDVVSRDARRLVLGQRDHHHLPAVV